MAYVRLFEAQSVNVGTVLHLPHSNGGKADLASGERATQGRGFVVVAGVTSGSRGGSTVHRAKEARLTAAPMK